MFAERFDALMNIAEVSNSLLGRNINMNASHIGRLRSGARPLSKKHDYLAPMCMYLAGRVKKDYQLNALQKLTGISNVTLESAESTALYLEQWLLAQEQGTTTATGRLISGFSRLASKPVAFSDRKTIDEVPQRYASYLYGNAGKRKAVEQFFLLILQEEEPQTLLLFSDENMAWLYEDDVFVARWTALFTQIISKGNRVQIIHTISRDLNELLEAVTKWIPIYMTGRIESYCYPRLRDGVFQRTLFIAPNTAAVVSSSVQQDTDGMLNLFITDKSAVEALEMEYQRYFMLCRPLMHVFTKQDAEAFRKAVHGLMAVEGNAYLCYDMPPFFAMPEKLVQELAEQTDSEGLLRLWKKHFATFCKTIKEQKLSLVLLDPKIALTSLYTLCPPLSEILATDDFSYTKEQYLLHIERLKQLEKKYENLTITFRTEIPDKLLLYVKEDVGVVMAKADETGAAFITNERNMINAFWDYLSQG